MDLAQAIDHTLLTFKNKAILTKRESWQGMRVWDKPDMVTYELTGHSVIAELRGTKSLTSYQTAIQPDLPWADDHFAERVSGHPLNPPPSEAWWPHATDNEKFKAAGIFSHTYPERFWPKEAGTGPNGIRFPVGDYADFISLLKREPYTRQAYLPIFFPEDTGNVARVRIPCTLGYHVLLTGDKVDLTYFIRSCDILRHFRNDVYFAVRLLLDILERLNTSPPWSAVRPGMLRMHIPSLHCFRNDYYTLFKERK